MTERQTPELIAGERLLVPATVGGEGLRGLPISFALHVALILIVGWTAVAPMFPALDESAGIIVVEIAKEPVAPDPAILPHPPQAAREASAEESSVAKASEPPAEPPSQPPAAPSVPPAEIPLAPTPPRDPPPVAPPTGMAPAHQPTASAAETAEIRTSPPEPALPEAAERTAPVEPPPATIEKAPPDVGSAPVNGESTTAEAVLAPEGSQTEPPEPTVAVVDAAPATTADSAPPIQADPNPPDAGVPEQTIAKAEATSGGPISPASPEMPAAAAIVAEAPNAEAPPAKTDAADAMAAQPATEQPAPQGPAETVPAAAAALPPDAVDAEAAPPPVEQLASQGPAETAPPAVVALPPTAAAMPPAAVEAMAAPHLAELPPPQGPAETEPPAPAAIPPAPVESMAAPTTAEQPVPQSAAKSAPSEATALAPIAELPSTDQAAASTSPSAQVAPAPAVPQTVEPPPPVALHGEVVQSTPDLPAKANTETDPHPPAVASAPPQDLPSSKAEILSVPSELMVIVEARRPDGVDPELKSPERQQMASIPVPLSASPAPPSREQGAPPSQIEMPAKPVSPILPVERPVDTAGSAAPARESKTEQQVAVLVPPAAKPPRPVPAEAINATLAALPCARVQATTASGAGGLILSGHVRSRADADGLAAKLSSIMDGQKVDRSALRILGEPYCQVLGFLDRPEFVRSTDQSHNEETLTAGVSVGTVRTFFGGQELQLDLVTPDFASEIIVDYFAADGTVVHLFPAKPGEGRFAPAKRVQIGGKDGVGRRVTIAPPYGMDIIVAIASSDRLFDPRRPVQESASGYLDALAETLARTAKASRKIEYTYYVVLTEPRPVARQ